MMGLYQTVIEVKNIVVGDLPYDLTTGDFYLSISVGTNPDMVTSLQESKHPKVVHFPEIMQLKIRHSSFEPRVHIKVKELNVIGSDELCECILSASAIMDWMDDEDPMKRFQMRCINHDIERETPPWLCLEFSRPTENRQIETLPASDMWAMPGGMGRLQVRTWEATENASPVKGGSTRPGALNSKYSDGTIIATRELKKRTIGQMKHDYQLLDDSGNPIEEPDEKTLDRITCCRNCVLCGFHLCNCLVFLAVLSYACFRFYVWSCYRQFSFMTMAVLNSQPLPISNAHLHDIVEKCHDKIRGTGTAAGMDTCRPNETQILYVCENLPQQNRPEAFVSLAYDILGVNIKGFTCFDGICKLRDKLAAYDNTCIAIAIGLILSTCVCRCLGNLCIKNMRKQSQKAQSDRILAAKTMKPGA
jgi:hypothetical protein